MQIGRGGPASGLVLFFILWASAAGAYELEYFVSLNGYDGHDGLSVATAFGSITRSVMALQAEDAAGNTPQARVIMQRGTYLSSALHLQFLWLDTVSFIGDSTGAWFGGSSGDIVVRNDYFNTTPYLVEVYQCRRPVAFQHVHFLADNVNSLAVVASVRESSRVVFADCKLICQVVSSATVFNTVLLLEQSREVELENSTIVFQDNSGVNNTPVTNVSLNQCQDVNFNNCRIEAAHASGSPTPSPTPHVLVYASRTSALAFQHCRLFSFTPDVPCRGFELAPDSNTTIVDSCEVSGTAAAVLLDNCWTASVQNCLFYNNGLGLDAQDARNCKVANNVICSNQQAGVRIFQESRDTVFFNN
ncbi:right-handed parallel beta-helix repeat-containing protein, partial [candidate division FCPU426 bacterium]|nr:right-handed parallel beta-helix repeat-containing protein [candidate division FCPU426 bacterium]